MLLTIILIVMLIVMTIKFFLCYSALAGVLYHISKEHNIELSAEKIKKLQISAGTKLIKEFFHLK